MNKSNNPIDSLNEEEIKQLIKKQFLKANGLDQDPTVVDCDPKNKKVTFSDGEGGTFDRTVTEVWTRVMGYHRPKESFNTGKKGEFEERKYFSESACNGPS